MTDAATLKILSCVLCDDVRFEFDGKQTLVGVRLGDIALPEIPSAVKISLWILGVWNGEGTIVVEIRILDPQGETVFSTQGTAVAIHQGRDSSLIFLDTRWTAKTAGEYELQWHIPGKKWHAIRTIPIVMEEPSPAG